MAPTKSAFSIKTEHFEGPLELLIELVEKRKLLINNISLASVTDEYITHVSDMQEQSLPNTAQFIALAATLLLIKSKSLLPVLELTDEEETSIHDLEDRLRLYQIYRDISGTIVNEFGSRMMYEPEYTPPREPLFLPDDFCTLPALLEAMERTVTNLPKPTVKQVAKVRATVSLEEMMDSLRTRIEKQIKTSFFKLKQEEAEHKNVIVGFLAILELFKQGNLIITQISKFEDIEIEVDKAATPRYY
ncbi:MAG: segregation and condensation protein segregation and condensation protein [Candidatus Parcubacteria bacterium]